MVPVALPSLPTTPAALPQQLPHPGRPCPQRNFNALAAGTWELLAGEVDKPGAKDGPHGTALLNQPTSICVNPAGVLIVADLGNACLRLVSPTGKLLGFDSTAAALQCCWGGTTKQPGCGVQRVCPHCWYLGSI